MIIPNTRMVDRNGWITDEWFQFFCELKKEIEAAKVIKVVKPKVKKAAKEI